MGVEGRDVADPKCGPAAGVVDVEEVAAVRNGRTLVEVRPQVGREDERADGLEALVRALPQPRPRA
jgi:hypothetical protein